MQKQIPAMAFPRLSLDSVFEVTVGGRFTGARESPVTMDSHGEGATQRPPGEFYFCAVLGWMTFDALGDYLSCL